MRRSAEEQAEKMARADVGDMDMMSMMAARAAITLCRRNDSGQIDADGWPLTCTRAQGHDEALPDHPGARHVSAGPTFVVLAVWR